MAKPLIVYGLEPILNPSFEDDEDLDAPTSWVTTASVSGINEVSATVFQSAGRGLPSARSLRQNTQDGTAGNKAIARQRFAADELVSILVEHEQELAIAAPIQPLRQEGLANASLRLRFFDSTGSSTPATGGELTSALEREFVAGGPIWFLMVGAARVPAGTAWVDVDLEYDIATAGFLADASVYWDRIMVGGLVDLDKGFRGGMTVNLEPGTRTNEGDGTAETLRIRGPRSRISLALANLVEDSRLWSQMIAFDAWLSTGVGFSAIWGDRDALTNAKRHYQRVVPDRRLRVGFPAGLLRRNYDLRLIAPNEGAA